MATFGGWSMPLRHGGTISEHHAVRDDVGAFDVSHLGTVWVQGPDAPAVVAATFTNDPGRLADGTSQYTLLCDDGGGIVDDLLLYRLSAGRFVTMPNAANTAAVVAALRDAARSLDAEVVDASTDLAVLAVQGPRSVEVTDLVLDGLVAGGGVAADTEVLGIRQVSLDDGAEVLVCRTGYTGERGVELILPAGTAPTVWERLLAAGCTPCGLAARDTLRLEMGYPLHGNDLSTDVTPFEARLGWAVKLDHGPFPGHAALVDAREAGPRRRLWGLVAEGRRPARAGLEVLSVDRAPVGRTTSGSLSPTLGAPIALALLDADLSVGDEVVIDVRGHHTPAVVTKPPFVDRDPRA